MTTIGSHRIAAGQPVFIIAEAGINHNGDIALAKELISAARTVGADAVKFQAFTADRMCDQALTETKKVEGITGGSNSSYLMYKRLELTCETLAELSAFAHKEGILFFASVFDEYKIDCLDKLDTPCFKISSGDLTHIPLIHYAAQKKRPLILSTGMATLDEIKRTVAVLEADGRHDIVLLHCTADYPPHDEELNLAVIPSLAQTFPYPVGYSDHSMGIAIPIAACAMGARVIEKHFTLDCTMDGPDHALSLDSAGFQNMVQAIRRIEHARGSAIKKPTPKEEQLRYPSRRGIKACTHIRAGEVITRDKVTIIKPAAGLAPTHLYDIVGKPAAKDIAPGEPLEWDMVGE